MEQSSTGPYFLGEQYSLADIAIAPFFGRLDAFNRLALKNDQFEAVKNSPRLAEFFEGILHRPSFKETFVGEDKFSSLLAARFSF